MRGPLNAVDLDRQDDVLSPGTRARTIPAPPNAAPSGNPEMTAKKGLTLRQVARRRRITSNVKSFIETLRVINVVRKSRANSRKRLLRGGVRPSLRSADSEINRSAFEPRNIVVASLRL